MKVDTRQITSQARIIQVAFKTLKEESATKVLYKKFMATVSVAKPKGIRGGKVTHKYRHAQLNQHISPLAATYFTSLMTFSCVILSLTHFVPLSHLFCTLVSMFCQAG